MATCFCGCGRRVRFTKKRLSKRGENVDRCLAILQNLSLVITRGEPEQQEVHRLIDDGHRIRAWYRDIIHDAAPAPPMHVQTSIFEREHDAGRLAARHASISARSSEANRVFDELTGVTPEMSRFLDMSAEYATGVPQTPAQKKANLRAMIERADENERRRESGSSPDSAEP